MTARTLPVLLLLAASLATSAAPTVLAASRPPTADPPAPPAATTASDLRITLGMLLGEHAYLVMEGMRATADDRADTDALVGGLEENTGALRDAVASVYGAAAGTAFEPVWQRHIDALLAWAGAHRAGDEAGMRAALDELEGYRAAFASFLQGANPELSGDAEAHALQLHLDQLTAFLDQDFAAAAATERAAYAHMFEFGDHLARAIVAQFPGRFEGGDVAFSRRTSLRLDLGRLLGEHFILAAVAMRAAVTDGADATAAVESLDANSADLASAVGQVFGPEAETAFADLWQRHITTYLRYIEAVAGDDEGGRSAALDELHGYHRELAAFLHGALPDLPAADVERLISHHVSALINQADAAAVGDHARTIAVTREAYRQMFDVASALGGAIADAFPDRFADVEELPRTDTLRPAGSAHAGAAVAGARLVCRVAATPSVAAPLVYPRVRLWLR